MTDTTHDRNNKILQRLIRNISHFFIGYFRQFDGYYNIVGASLSCIEQARNKDTERNPVKHANQRHLMIRNNVAPGCSGSFIFHDRGERKCLGMGNRRCFRFSFLREPHRRRSLWKSQAYENAWKRRLSLIYLALRFFYIFLNRSFVLHWLRFEWEWSINIRNWPNFIWNKGENM